MLTNNIVIANWSHSSSSDYSGQVPQATGQASLALIPSRLFLLQRPLLGFLETHWQVRFLRIQNQSALSTHAATGAADTGADTGAELGT